MLKCDNYGNGSRLLVFVTQLNISIMEQTFTVTYPAKDVEKKIEEYFNGVEHKVSVTMMGRTADADISYVDFKPTRKVRRELEDLIPNLEIMSLDRTYSKEQYLNIIDEIASQSREIYVKEADGTLKPTDLMLLLEEELYCRTLTGHLINN